MLSADQIAQALPPQLKGSVNQKFVDLVNDLSADPEVAEHIRNNFLSYAVVLKDGKFKTEDYAHAVAYVSYKLMGLSNREAYVNTFPQRYQTLKARGATDRHISAYVAAYNKGKLVNLILEQTLIPVWVLNQDIYQKAINTQADLMLNAKSEKVRSDAANSILTHLKKPEKKEIELAISVPENSGMTELRDMLTSLAERQKALIDQGVTTREIAHQPIVGKATSSKHADVIDAEAVDVTDR